MAGRRRALGVLAALLAAGCSHEVEPTPRYSTAQSIPQPIDLTVRPSSPGPRLIWVAPDSDFEIVAGWFVYRQRPEEEALRVTPEPLLQREFNDQEPPVLGTTEYWVTAVSRGGVESLPTPRVPYFVDNRPPAAPTSLSAIVESVRVLLSWVPGTEPDLAGYFIYRDGLLFGSANEPTQPFFLDFQISPGETHRYAVSAFDFQNLESGRSEEITVTIP